MASYVETFRTKIGQPAVYQRLSSSPLDRSSMFSALTDAQEYAKGEYIAPGESTPAPHDSRKLAGMSYIGQIITVYENDVVTAYQIDYNRELKMLGGGSVDCGDY